MPAELHLASDECMLCTCPSKSVNVFSACLASQASDVLQMRMVKVLSLVRPTCTARLLVHVIQQLPTYLLVDTLVDTPLSPFLFQRGLLGLQPDTRVPTPEDLRSGSSESRALQEHMASAKGWPASACTQHDARPNCWVFPAGERFLGGAVL